ncbi:MAG: PD-(D/E)XK nuclease family protein [Abditibacteriota bacterium]|nr:PD-(D/E)XK nuclease family protein [Abditibacteriota bacterium]
MADILPPTISYSQLNIFNKCKRSYFYDKYWSILGDESKWDAWRMKYITSIPMLKGACIHHALRMCILDYKHNGRNHSLNDAIFYFRKSLREKYLESDKGHWKNPKVFGKRLQDVTNLFEHFYHDENALQKAQKAEEVGIKAIESLWTSPIWERVLATPYEDFMTIDEENFPKFNVIVKNLPERYKEFSDMTVYAVIDLAIKYNKTLRIIDWKTGKESDSSKLQLAIYALYANSVWHYEIGEIKFYLCYLGEKTTIKTEEINVPTIMSSYNILVNTYREMLELYNFGEPVIDNFPKTEDIDMCEICKYKGLCNKG